MHQRIDHCGGSLPHDFHSIGNQVEVTFVSDSTNVRKGFKLEYRIESESKPSSSWSLGPYFIPLSATIVA